MARSPDKRLSRVFWALASLAAAYLCFWLLPGVFSVLNLKAVDRLFQFRSQVASLRPVYDDTVVHVDLNDSSIEELDNYYLNRTHYARIIRNLTEMEVNAQLFDFIFPARSSDEADRSLIEAVSAAGNVYFGMAFKLGNGHTDQKGDPRSSAVRNYLEKTCWRLPLAGTDQGFYTAENPLLSFSALSEAANGTGFINVKPDPDGVFRKIPRGAALPDQR